MLIRPQDINRNGLDPVYVELTDPVVSVPNNSAVFLHVIYEPEGTNDGSVVVTVYPDDKYRAEAYGRAQTLVESGPIGGFIGCFPNEAYTNDSSDCMTAYFSTIDGVRVSALRVSRT